MVESGLPREAERILLALNEKTRLTTREVVEEADLATTQSVHHYVSDYLDSERELVFKNDPEPGKQAEWEITHAGEMWVEGMREDIAIPQTAEEAAEVARKAKEKAESAESSASTITGSFRQHKLDVASEIGSVREDLNEVEAEFAELDDDVQNQVGSLKRKVEEIDQQFETLVDEINDFIEETAERFERERKNTRWHLDKKAHDTDLIKAELRIEDLEEESESQDERLDRIEGALETINQYVDEDLFESRSE